MIRALLALVLALWLAGPALAQSTDAAWDALARQTETALEGGRASDQALADLRRRVAAARTGFATAQEANATRITTLEAQVTALGPETEGEPAELTAQRADLSAQLAQLRAPVRQAEAAYNQADGLILEIDRVLRSRQTDAILRLGPSPVLPDQWSPALAKLQRSWSSLTRELSEGWNSAATRSALQTRLPSVLGYLVLAAVLAFRARAWVRMGLARARAGTMAGSGVWSLVDSLAGIALPLGALYALVAAITAMDLHGLRGALILAAVPGWGAAILVTTWLAGQLCDDHGTVVLPRTAIAWTLVLALALVGADALSQVARYDSYSEAEGAVLRFPLMIAAGVALMGLGRSLMQTSGDEDALRMTFLPVVGRATMAVGGLSILLAAIGYGTGAMSLIQSTAQTLALGAAVLVGLTLLTGIYQLVTGRTGDDSLLPVLAGLVLTLAALPVLALIWGARWTDLLELWARFLEGANLGGVQLSPGTLVAFGLVFAAGYIVTRVVQGLLKSRVLPRTRLDAGAQSAAASGAGYVGMVIAAVVAFGAAGVDLSSLAIVAGALSVGIGFGLQNIVSNFVSGIILLVERPISTGDWIEVGGIHGTVRDISVRSTRIETFDRSDVILPNAELISGTVTNYTKGNDLGRVLVPVGVSYDADPRHVQRVLLAIAREHDMVLMNPEPAVDFLGFGDNSMDFRIRAVLRDVNYIVSVRNDMNYEIARRFKEEGIEIPYPQRDLHLRTGFDSLVPSGKEPT